jgi:sugar diacid utilization regulator
MMCSNFDYTPGVAQIYEFILEKLLHYLQPLVEKSSYRRTQFDYFMIEILDGKVKTPLEIYERSSVYGRTYSDAFHTVLIQLEQSSDMYLAHLLQALNQQFPEVYTLLYNDRILMHFDRKPGRQDLWFEQLDRLNDLLESSHAHAGISEPLTGIDSIYESYRQAKFTLEYGIKMLGKKRCNHYLGEDMDLPRLFSLGEYHVFNMLAGKETEAPILQRIHKFDEEHGTDYHRILFVYLSSERNFTHAARILHMHRNNVIYHIRRISDIFNLDLDRPNLRLRLLMLYRLEDMYQ